MKDQLTIAGSEPIKVNMNRLISIRERKRFYNIPITPYDLLNTLFGFSTKIIYLIRNIIR